MQKRTLGKSNVEATRIALGTWAIGGSGWGGTDEQESIRTIRTAIDKGITMIDTAPAYGEGLSEELVGKAVRESGKSREDLVIATKAGINFEGGASRDSRPGNLENELNRSLQLLQTDYIDVYQIHWPDTDEPIENTAKKMKEFFDEGKIRAIGVSNFSPEQMDEWQKYAPIHTSQMHLNMLQRYLIDWFEYCNKHDIATLSWGSLAHGMLTGKFTKDAEFPEGDLRSNIELFQGNRFPAFLDAVEELRDFADERNLDLIQLAVRWLMDHEPGADFVLWGARKPSQLEGVQKADEAELSSEDLQEIDNILYNHVSDLNNGNLNEYGPPLRSEK
ncbi:aldo/keto reductase [Salimicrobium humidisoli]|uniref:General stress protein n=1 Tax=Salimicrobium humidisoli TaxID=2029857 RepID=A0ABX4HUF7_9BACI|nr:aldo/keto reductase [Salimicrobium humidisoli]PBB06555.1 general stress protein [Salimicrobium humidisoli]